MQYTFIQSVLNTCYVHHDAEKSFQNLKDTFRKKDLARNLFNKLYVGY